MLKVFLNARRTRERRNIVFKAQDGRVTRLHDVGDATIKHLVDIEINASPLKKETVSPYVGFQRAKVRIAINFVYWMVTVELPHVTVHLLLIEKIETEILVCGPKFF